MMKIIIITMMIMIIMIGVIIRLCVERRMCVQNRRKVAWFYAENRREGHSSIECGLNSEIDLSVRWNPSNRVQ